MRDELVKERKNVELEESPEFEERVVQIDRVTRVVKGGRRLRFRATVVVGNKNGRVGVGVDKGNEVMTAVQKATARAKKSMIDVQIKNTTISHEVSGRQAGAYVFLKPASEGTGVIAGGAVRAVLEAAGIKDILSKMIGSNSKINNAYATIMALGNLKKFNPMEKKESEVAAEKKTTKKKPEAGSLKQEAGK